MAMSDEDAAQRAHRDGLIADHTKRLQALERQEARQGHNTPPEVVVEIADIQKQIARLKALAVDQIKHPFVRGFLERAVATQQAKNYVEAAGQAMGGLRWALYMVKPALLGWDGRPDERDRQAELMTLFHVLHLDYTTYVRIITPIGTIDLVLGGTKLYIDRPSIGRDGHAPEIGPELADQAITFATEAIVTIEEQAGDLDQPFGREGIKVP
jgi:hypothetical protein